jgi:hypothetical protein
MKKKSSTGKKPAAKRSTRKSAHQKRSSPADESNDRPAASTAETQPARRRAAPPPTRGYLCEIVSPDPAGSVIDVTMGLIDVAVKAEGDTPVDLNFGVGALTYLDGTTAPTPGGGLVEDPATGLWKGQISAPCHHSAPYPKFRIVALAFFVNPSGDPMDPPVDAGGDKGPFQGRCR